jgi:hypothetical protein
MKLRLAASHADRYFLFETDYGDEGDPWAPYGRVYDRVAENLFQPVPMSRLAELGDFFEEWSGHESERVQIEREAGSLLE